MIMVSPAPGKYALVGLGLDLTCQGWGHGVTKSIIGFYANIQKKSAEYVCSCFYFINMDKHYKFRYRHNPNIVCFI